MKAPSWASSPSPRPAAASSSCRAWGRPNAPSAWRATAGADSETTLDGNAVSLEDQMLKMTDARMNYDAAISFYQKSMTMLRMAARKPSG